MKDKLRILLRIALVLLLVGGVTVGVLYANRDIGIPTDQLEQAMRESQDIPDDWTVQTSAGDTTAAGIAYAPNHSDYVFSLYTDRDTHRFFTTGWFSPWAAACLRFRILSRPLRCTTVPRPRIFR